MILATFVRKDVTDNPTTTDTRTVKYSKAMCTLCARPGKHPSMLVVSDGVYWPVGVVNAPRSQPKFIAAIRHIAELDP
jgi:hypothetical protein